jgi:hypothetical protein
MRNVVICISLMLFCCSCIEKDYQNIENELLNVEGVVYLFDNDQNRYEAKVHLEKEDSLALWNIVRNGVQTQDQYDQGLGWFKFHLNNNKIIFVELGRSGIARYNSKIAKIDLILFEQFIKKHLTDESGKQLNEPNIFNFPK